MRFTKKIEILKFGFKQSLCFAEVQLWEKGAMKSWKPFSWNKYKLYLLSLSFKTTIKEFFIPYILKSRKPKAKSKVQDACKNVI